MTDLIKYLEQDVSTRYAGSLTAHKNKTSAVLPISAWDHTQLLTQHACKKKVNLHKAEINHQIVLGSQPSLAPLFIRHYLGLGTDIVSEIASEWGEHTMNGFSLEELGQFVLDKMSLAEPVIQLGFFCAAKEIDPLRAYELEHKYNNLAYQHLIHCVLKAYESDKQKQVNGARNHASLHPYYSTLLNVVFLYAQNTIEFLTKARDDLSGKSCQIDLSC